MSETAKKNENEAMDLALEVRDKIIDRLRTVYDPEIPVSLYDLGLIYRLDLQPVAGESRFDATIDMTLTAPGCPVAHLMPDMVRRAVMALPELNDVQVNLVWDPPWDRSRLSDEARLQLNLL